MQNVNLFQSGSDWTRDLLCPSWIFSALSLVLHVKNDRKKCTSPVPREGVQGQVSQMLSLPTGDKLPEELRSIIPTKIGSA